MAQQVQIAGVNSTAKIRNPIAVAIFAVITLGIYVLLVVLRQPGDGRLRAREGHE